MSGAALVSPATNTAELEGAFIANDSARKSQTDDYTAADKLSECSFNAKLRGDFAKTNSE